METLARPAGTYFSRVAQGPGAPHSAPAQWERGARVAGASALADRREVEASFSDSGGSGKPEIVSPVAGSEKRAPAPDAKPH